MKNRKIWMGVVLTLLCTLLMGVSVFAANTTMKNKKWVTGECGVFVDTDKDGVVDDFRSNGKAYYKLKIPKQGYIMVDMKTSKLPKQEEYSKSLEDDWAFATSVTLLNLSKKEVDESVFSTGERSICFSSAVKKGTYYLRVEGEQKYKLRYTFKAVGKLSKVGKRAKNAPGLKKGTTAKNLLYPDPQMNVYKISLTKKSKVSITVQSKIKSLSGLRVQLAVKKGNKYRFVDKKGKILSNDDLIWWPVEGKGKISATLPKGIYYIKLSTVGGSGYYTLKWK